MSFVRVIAEEADIPLQDFVVRNDSRCGGTVGAMLSARLGKAWSGRFFDCFTVVLVSDFVIWLSA